MDDLLEDISDLEKLIRDIPHYPETGVTFKDLFPVYNNRWGINELQEALSRDYHDLERLDKDNKVTKLVIAASRGYILGSSVASFECVGLVAAHKNPRPIPQYNVQYYREYGENQGLYIDQGLIEPGEHVILHDDVLATGGTIVAMKELVHLAGGIVRGVILSCELEYLNGRDHLIQSGLENDQIKSVLKLAS